jgi:ATP-binding cassette, subfamily B, bacterial PglK
MLSTVRKCLEMLPPGHRLRWALLTPLGLLAGAVEAGAAAAVFGLITIIGDPARASTIPVARTIATILPWKSPAAVILAFTLLVALYHVVKNGLVVATAYVRHKFAGEADAALSCSLLKGYLTAPYPLHFRRNSAELIRNLNEAVRTVFKALDSAMAVLTESLVAAGIASVMIAAAPQVTLIAGVVLISLLFVLLRVTKSMASRYGHGLYELNRRILQSLQQALGGIKEIKALGRERYFYEAYARRRQEMMAVGYVETTLEVLPPLVIETVFVCGALAVVALVTASGPAGPEGLPVIALFAYGGFRIVPSANRVTWRLNEIRAARKAVDALYEDHALIAEGEWPADGNGSAPRFSERIEVAGVGYTYPAGETPVLHDVSLTVAHGESIGIVGPTGAGKSTLVDLIAGLLEPTSGSITVDGIPLADRITSWKRRIGYVPQSIYLTDDSLRRNIALGIGDAEIDEQRIEIALRLAQLEDFVHALPNGLDTSVGERGVRLSGGERQRVGIARALYHDPDVLLFDEATSALDGTTEQDVGRAIDSLVGEKTMIIVAHRPSTVRRCQRLVYLRDGRVEDCGAFEEIAARNADFRRMLTGVAPAS